ncbi:MAG: transposase [Deltaproteobacteria bacterium]|nr:transposase [Deltaproteobacteria bacterium]
MHLLVSYSSKPAMSKLVQKLKGRSSRKLMLAFPCLPKRYWGRNMWARLMRENCLCLQGITLKRHPNLLPPLISCDT